MRVLRLQVLPLLILHCGAVMADWADPGVVYRCDVEHNVLSFRSVMETSSPDPGRVDAPLGYRPVKSDKKFKCSFGTTQVNAHFEVAGPLGSGTCAGYTHTYVLEFKVNGRSVLPQMQSINSTCSDLYPDPYQIEIRQVGRSVHIETCYATWSWGVGYTRTKCESQDL